MATTLSLHPLFRHTVGFDRFSDLFQSMQGEDNSSSYPPYNIVKHGENLYSITMAVAGFSADSLTITAQRDRLTINGRNEEKAEAGEYLHRGIAARVFERNFRLADHVKVTGAELRDGLLRVDLVREVPEEQKARMIPINNTGTATTIDQQSAKKKAN